MNNIFYGKVFKELVRIDLLIFREVIVDKLIDVTIWVTLNTAIMAYIMPYFGISKDFGVLQLGGVIAGVGLFELYRKIIDLIVDFEGDRIINYYLTLPIPSWLMFLSKSTYFAISNLILSLFMLPVGKIVLWNKLDLGQINYGKLIIALSAGSLFYGFFALFAASLIPSMAKIGRAWARFIFPMWFMGGFQFTWKALYHALPTVAFINLINPIIYITESTRAALLGPKDYINFWVCIFVLLFFSTFYITLGIIKLKKKLDVV